MEQRISANRSSRQWSPLISLLLFCFQVSEGSALRPWIPELSHVVKLQSVSHLNLQLDPDVNPILRWSIFYSSHISEIPNSLKLQDLPERILQARNEFWPRDCPEAIEEKRIEFQSMDFLTESPIKNCNVYLVRWILMFLLTALKLYTFLLIIVKEYHVGIRPLNSIPSSNSHTLFTSFPATTGLIPIASKFWRVCARQWLHIVASSSVSDLHFPSIS